MFPENPTPSLVVLVFCVCDMGLCLQFPLLGRGADTILLSRTCLAVGGAAHLALNPQVPIFPEVEYPGQRSTCNHLLCARRCTSSVCTLPHVTCTFPCEISHSFCCSTDDDIRTLRCEKRASSHTAAEGQTKDSVRVCIPWFPVKTISFCLLLLLSYSVGLLRCLSQFCQNALTQQQNNWQPNLKKGQST